MTRDDAIRKASDILDDLAERDLARYFDDHGYDAAIEDELRREIAEWKVTALAEIEQKMSAMVRSMMH